jgi:polar amino acid transport system substrate-binding protein
LVVFGWLLLMGVAAAQTRPGDDDRLRGGWYPWDPYQYSDYSRGVQILTGLDVEIQRALARIMGVELVLTQSAWNDQLAALAGGTMDIAAGATKTEARGRQAYFSKPYRTETNVLILPRGASSRYPFRTIDEMLAAFKTQKFRLGVGAGFVYADSKVNAFIADDANQEQIVIAATDAQNLRNLLAGVIDGFLADQITATTTAWRRDEGSHIEQHPLHFSTDIHFMLSRTAQTPQMLARLDGAIDELRRSGKLGQIAARYAVPVLINETLDTQWFHVLAFLGIVAFALSGVLLAHEGHYTLFGALILAALPAVGGGTVRDLLLQRNPVGIVRNPEALLIVFGTVLAGLVIIRVLSLVPDWRPVKYLKSRVGLGVKAIEVFDAIGLAAFTVTGVVVVLDTSAQPLWLWGPVAAAIASSFGGLIRDLFRRDRVVTDVRRELYPEIAAVWGLALSLVLEWEGERLQPEEIWLAVMVTIVGVFTTRMVAIARGWRGWRYA